MTPAIARNWIDAMRSGKYKKGRNVLRNSDNEYCGLGVLQHVIGGEFNDHKNFISQSMLSTEEQIAVMALSDRSRTFEPVIRWVAENCMRRAACAS